METLTLTTAELSELCPGITQPAAMVRHLQNMGFVRAHLHYGKVVLSRAHYDAVERGEFDKRAPGAKNEPRLRSATAA